MPRRIAIMLVLVVLAVLAFAGVALADQSSYLNGKIRSGDVVVIPVSETVRTDLYAFATTVTVDGTIDGDLVATGSQIIVNGTVNGSIMAAGSTITVNGQTKGSIRAAGGQVYLNGPVGRDAVVASGQFSSGAGAKIGQDVIFATGTASIGGPVTGSILGSAGTYSRSGSVGGTEEVSQNRTTDAGTRFARSPFEDALRQLAAALLVGLVIIWLRPRLLSAWDSLLRARPAAAFGYGVLALIGFVAATIVAIVAVVVLAIILGVLTLGALVAVDVIAGLLLVALGITAFIVVCAFVVDAVVGYVIGRMILRSAKLGLAGPWQSIIELALGTAIVVAAQALPVIGGIVGLVTVLFGLGVLTLYFWNLRPATARAAAAPAS